MRVEVIGVGTELLLGQIANTNAQWIGVQLAEIGADVLFHQVVGDNLDRIVAVIDLAASRADVVLVTGGLGPTEDDITRDAIALVMHAPLERDPALERWLRERFAGFADGSMPENNLRQADVPRGARPIENDRGVGAGPRSSPTGWGAHLRHARCAERDERDDAAHRLAGAGRSASDQRSCAREPCGASASGSRGSLRS